MGRAVQPVRSPRTRDRSEREQAGCRRPARPVSILDGCSKKFQVKVRTVPSIGHSSVKTRDAECALQNLLCAGVQRLQSPASGPGWDSCRLDSLPATPSRPGRDTSPRIPFPCRFDPFPVAFRLCELRGERRRSCAAYGTWKAGLFLESPHGRLTQLLLPCNRASHAVLMK